jgi:hypothetical protein
MSRPIIKPVSLTLYYRHPDGSLYCATGWGETEPDAAEHAMQLLDGVISGPLSLVLTEAEVPEADRAGCRKPRAS